MNAPRRWLSLHLLSLLTATLTAATVLFLNFRVSETLDRDHIVTHAATEDSLGKEYLLWTLQRGWPTKCYREEGFGILLTSNEKRGKMTLGEADPEWEYGKLAINLAVGLALVLASAATCEFLLWRFAQKG